MRFPAAAAFSRLTEIGPADVEGRQIGPVVSDTQFNKIQYLIKRGFDERATLVAGGLGRPEGLERGYFVRPTVFADVTSDMTLWKEEVFGPVLVMTPFDTEEEAIALANDSLCKYIEIADHVLASHCVHRDRFT